MKTKITIIIFLTISNFAFSQKDSCMTLLLVDKNKELEIKKNMAKFSRTGFY